jgi:broad specificity phosphatase PhoE
MKIFLVRHGEADANLEELPLTEKGVVQAKAVAKELMKYTFSKAYSSDILRAKDTAKEYLKLNPGIEYIEDQKLQEIYRVVIGGPVREGTPPEREEVNRKRGDNIFNELLKEEKDVVVFCHGNIIRYFINKIFDSKKNLWNTVIISNGSISILEFKEGKLQVNLVNGVEHLGEKEAEGGVYLE